MLDMSSKKITMEDPTIIFEVLRETEEKYYGHYVNASGKDICTWWKKNGKHKEFNISNYHLIIKDKP